MAAGKGAPITKLAKCRVLWWRVLVGRGSGGREYQMDKARRSKAGRGGTRRGEAGQDKALGKPCLNQPCKPTKKYFILTFILKSDLLLLQLHSQHHKPLLAAREDPHPTPPRPAPSRSAPAAEGVREDRRPLASCPAPPSKLII